MTTIMAITHVKHFSLSHTASCCEAIETRSTTCVCVERRSSVRPGTTPSAHLTSGSSDKESNGVLDSRGILSALAPVCACTSATAAQFGHVQWMQAAPDWSVAAKTARSAATTLPPGLCCGQKTATPTTSTQQSLRVRQIRCLTRSD